MFSPVKWDGGGIHYRDNEIKLKELLARDNKMSLSWAVLCIKKVLKSLLIEINFMAFWTPPHKRLIYVF
jgi:hypothetical protein